MPIFDPDSLFLERLMCVKNRLSKHMKYIISWIIIMGSFQFLGAQELVAPPLPYDDSAKFSKPVLYEPGLNLTGLKSELPVMADFNSRLAVPEFDFSGYLKTKWRVDYTSTGHFFMSPENGWFTSLFGTGTVFNQAVFQASDKLKIGGNSFGINSLLHAPLPGIGPGNYDYRGVSVFMEYKITKNLRVGGSISVSGNPYQP
jgi:hypothetical protein